METVNYNKFQAYVLETPKMKPIAIRLKHDNHAVQAALEELKRDIILGNTVVVEQVSGRQYRAYAKVASNEVGECLLQILDGGEPLGVKVIVHADILLPAGGEYHQDYSVFLKIQNPVE